jgi:hypothetical protein
MFLQDPAVHLQNCIVSYMRILTDKLITTSFKVITLFLNKSTFWRIYIRTHTLFCLQARQQRCLQVQEDQEHPQVVQILCLIPQVSTKPLLHGHLQHCIIKYSLCVWSHKKVL